MRINYQSDFKIIEKNMEGDASTPFKFSYYTVTTPPVVASFDGNTYVNCRRTPEGDVLVAFNNHGMGQGVLFVKREYFLTDSDFADGICNLVSVDVTGIALTDGKTENTVGTIEVYPNYQKGDKGDTGNPLTWETLTTEQRQLLLDTAANAALTENRDAYISEGMVLLQDSVQLNSIIVSNGTIDPLTGWQINTAEVKKGDAIFINLSDKAASYYGMFAIYVGGALTRMVVGGDGFTSSGMVLKAKSDCTIRYSVPTNRIPRGDGLFKITMTDVTAYLSSAQGSVAEMQEAVRQMQSTVSGLSTQVSAKANTADVYRLTKRKVLWLGTSIPEGSPYPQNACANLKHQCFNKALGSSGIVVHTGVLGNDRDGKDLAESTAEKVARYQGHIGDGTGGTVTQQRYDQMMNWGYDKLLLPYIDGTIQSCDMVVIDHGYNDREEITQEILDNFNTLDLSIDKDPSEYDRSTYVGAFCFLVNQIYRVNPYIKIVVCSYIENRTGSPEFPTDNYQQKGYLICKMEQKLAEHFNFPFLNMCDYNGFTLEFVPNTENFLSGYNAANGTSYTAASYTGKPNPNGLVSMKQLYCPDRVHPHSDKTGNATKILTASITKLLKDL